MQQLRPTKTVYTVSQFLEWQRAKTLQLTPVFQRRAVWPPKLKSLFIDTIVRGFPIPIIFLRQVQDLKTLATSMEVVDGQQRLRTLFSFIDPACLADYVSEHDDFLVQSTHNTDIARTPFGALDDDIKRSILGYEISTHVFPPDTDDTKVLMIFARLNSTGAGLTHQELRNAKWYGEFKTLSYALAFQNLQRWRTWGIFPDDQIARMFEVESTSDYLLTIMTGIYGKSQAKLDSAYKDYDDQLPGADELRHKFDEVMDTIEGFAGRVLKSTRLRRPALFYSLFSSVYDCIYGFDAAYSKHRKAKPVPRDSSARLLQLSTRIVDKTLPSELQDAMDKSTADYGRRKTRHDYFMKALGFGSA